MGQADDLVAALKRTLKARGMSYRMLAGELGLSEASVKRVFSNKTFSLDRLEAICRILQIELYDLVKMAKRRSSEESAFLTPEQDRTLASDEMLFTFFYLLLMGTSPGEICKRYRFTQAQSMQHLVRLDRLGLIELHPGDRIRFLVSKNVRWQDNGPLHSRYDGEIKKEFMNSDFAEDSTGGAQRIRLLNAELSDAAIKSLARKIDKWIAEFKDLAADTPTGGRGRSIWFLLAYRPWTFSVMSRYRR